MADKWFKRHDQVVQIIKETPEWAPSWIVHIEKQREDLHNVRNDLLVERDRYKAALEKITARGVDDGPYAYGSYAHADWVRGVAKDALHGSKEKPSTPGNPRPDSWGI